MKRLTKTQEKRFSKLLADLDEAQDAVREAAELFDSTSEAEWAKVEEAICKFNDERATAWDDVEEAREKAGAALEALEEFRAEVAQELEAFRDEKSEKWQESDAGSEFSDWLDRWCEEGEVAEHFASLEDPPEAVEVEAPGSLAEEGLEVEETWADEVATLWPLDVEGDECAWMPKGRGAPAGAVMVTSERPSGLVCGDCARAAGNVPRGSETLPSTYVCEKCGKAASS